MSDAFPAEKRIALASATIRGRDPIAIARSVFTILHGVIQARAALTLVDPAIVVGFGGYPSLPALIGALSQGRRTVIHEQNAVSGRANRLIAPYASAVACAFPTLLKARPGVQARAVVVGNPVRPEIRALAGLAYQPPSYDVRLLVTGGSQGARFLSELVPAAVAALPEELRLRLRVQQQTRPENMDEARRVYANALVPAEVAPFFRDMAGRLATAHLVIGRAGASTVSEIAVAGRPSILVPLKIALDDDQGQNARVLAEGGRRGGRPRRRSLPAGPDRRPRRPSRQSPPPGQDGRRRPQGGRARCGRASGRPGGSDGAIRKVRPLVLACGLRRNSA